MSKLQITIYRITGQQFFLKVPNFLCEECELTVQQVKRVLQELGLAGDAQVKLEIKPWMQNMGEALALGGWHAPVLVINGRVFSQGIVPNRAELRTYLQRFVVKQVG